MGDSAQPDPAAKAGEETLPLFDDSDCEDNITELNCPVLMQTYISRIDLTTAQSRVVPGLKVVKGLNGRMRCYGIGWCMNQRVIFVHSVPKESTSIRDRIIFKGIIPF